MSETFRPQMYSQEEREYIYGACRITLGQEKAGKTARDYLYWQRALDVETVAKFRLGYVPPEAKHVFSGHIMMPIFDMYGKLISLSFRPIFKFLRTKERQIEIVQMSEKKDFVFVKTIDGFDLKIKHQDIVQIDDPNPKYWNEAFPKGEHLYGLWLAKYAIPQYGFAIVVEGQVDVMMMHANGFHNTVGLLGGGFTPIHAMLLKRWTRQIVILMDGDSAGKKHSEKMQDILNIYGVITTSKKRLSDKVLKYSVAPLPDKMDPDSFLKRHGSGVMKKIICEAMVTGGLIVPKKWNHQVSLDVKEKNNDTRMVSGKTS